LIPDTELKQTKLRSCGIKARKEEEKGKAIFVTDRGVP
jgi:hypothetical protein